LSSAKVSLLSAQALSHIFLSTCHQKQMMGINSRHEDLLNKTADDLEKNCCVQGPLWGQLWSPDLSSIQRWSNCTLYS